MYYRPLYPVVIRGVCARPAQPGCGWWGGGWKGQNRRKPPGAWGGQSPPTGKGYALLPIPTTLHSGIFASLRWIYRQAGTSPPHLVRRVYIQTPSIHLVISLMLPFLFYVGVRFTKVLCLSSTIMGVYFRLRSGIIRVRGGDAYETKYTNIPQVLVQVVHVLHSSRSHHRGEARLSTMPSQVTIGVETMPRHQFTREESRQGFRKAVLAVQIKHNLDFNEAVQWLLRRINPGGDWQAYRNGTHHDKP